VKAAAPSDPSEEQKRLPKLDLSVRSPSLALIIG
jgi:hypothetical protein